ncbi:hypothetical protein VC83_06453 [Pseudogymnoascus destructans]|uniref:Uncharacterized protein n=1 Tax=Pseudogymnoascus destructans TaxID=655981 RepID=A0A177A893_9PEZI|nr:uncharacterized protein VC83_06453 [Pseudogymnoascus destructans]OAF58385.1 hypothetical protein VC83_06453 [Pseudogymnoascus destructans]
MSREGELDVLDVCMGVQNPTLISANNSHPHTPTLLHPIQVETSPNNPIPPEALSPLLLTPKKPIKPHTTRKSHQRSPPPSPPPPSPHQTNTPPQPQNHYKTPSFDDIYQPKEPANSVGKFQGCMPQFEHDLWWWSRSVVEGLMFDSGKRVSGGIVVVVWVMLLLRGSRR